ncbi:hypothetical protein [Embleya sp. MST-111070]|uniref:hypothetical protein n=1 Tax=Embleya sp. MST-111070 TaxID=3398231 RepID=UPI003F7406F2
MAAIAAMAVAVFVIAQAVGADRFNEFYGNALVFLAYLFTPWTAINLVDFFFVRRGTYVMAEIFKRDGPSRPRGTAAAARGQRGLDPRRQRLGAGESAAAWRGRSPWRNRPRPASAHLTGQVVLLEEKERDV